MALLVMQGAVLTFFAFIGFEDTLNVAEECRDPQRTIPIALVVVDQVLLSWDAKSHGLRVRLDQKILRSSRPTPSMSTEPGPVKRAWPQKASMPFSRSAPRFSPARDP
jgi:hypothetical protein